MRSKIALLAMLAGLALPAAAQAQGVAILDMGAYPTFQNYIMAEHIPSFAYEGPVEVGTVLPAAGLQYYPMPAQFGVPAPYSYTVVNSEPVIVDPYHRIVQVIP